MLRIILADAELELPPAELAGHPSIRASADAQGKRPGEILLDQNQHSAALAKLPDGKRRGRPDIVQITLLGLLESPLAKKSKLELVIHTRNAQLIRVRTDTRLPRSEARFQGLLSKVLREGRSNDDPKPWLTMEPRQGPNQVLAAIAKGPVLRLDETAGITKPADVVRKATGPDADLTLVLGVFPSGDFSTGWKTAVPDAVSIWPESLVAWAVAAEVTSAYRAVWGP